MKIIPNYRWSDQEIALLFNQPPHGLTDSELSGILCRSKNAIRVMRSKHSKHKDGAYAKAKCFPGHFPKGKLK